MIAFFQKIYPICTISAYSINSGVMTDVILAGLRTLLPVFQVDNFLDNFVKNDYRKNLFNWLLEPIFLKFNKENLGE